MNNPMITLPLKTTEEADWVSPLKSYIGSVYGNADDYKEEIAALNRLRQDIRGAGKDASGKDLLYKYFGQLELLDLRIPVREDACNINFSWYDAYSHECVTQHSLAFEKASVLFNLAAILSHIGEDSRDSKSAYNSFQTAAGVFAYIGESFLHAPSADLKKENVKVLSKLMLAQAQEAFIDKLVKSGGGKPSMIAKLANQDSLSYKSVVEGLQLSLSKGWGERSWVSLCQVKSQYMASFALYQQAQHMELSGKHGAAIAFLLESVSEGQAASRLYIPPAYNSVQTSIKSYLEIVEPLLETWQKDNDLIYHEPVPGLTALGEIGKLEAAKATPMSDMYGEQDVASVIGRDLFERIIPLSVHEQSSLYSEEKASLLRAEGEKSDVADEELSSALEYMSLPQASRSLREVLSKGSRETSSPARISELCRSIKHSSPINFNAQESDRRQIHLILQEVENTLRNEEKEYSGMKAKYGPRWTQTPSTEETLGFWSSVTSIKEKLAIAASLDNSLSLKYSNIKPTIDLLLEGPNSSAMKHFLASSSKSNDQSLLDIQTEDSSSPTELLNQVDELILKLNKVRRERSAIMSELKEKIHKDDISSILVLNRRTPSVERDLFRSELEKFNPYIKKLSSNIKAQNGLLKELNDRWKAVLSNDTIKKNKEIYDRATQSNASTMGKLEEAPDVLAEVEDGYNKSKIFYSQLISSAKSLSEDVKNFVSRRQSEGYRILQTLYDHPPRGQDATIGFQNLNINSPSAPPPPLPRKESDSTYSSYSSPGRSYIAQSAHSRPSFAPSQGELRDPNLNWSVGGLNSLNMDSSQTQPNFYHNLSQINAANLGNRPPGAVQPTPGGAERRSSQRAEQPEFDQWSQLSRLN